MNGELERTLAPVVAALGGAGWRTRDQWSAKGRVETLGGLTGDFRATWAAPDRFAIQWELPGMSFGAGHDGELTWDCHGALRILADDEAARLRRLIRLDPLLPHLAGESKILGVDGTTIRLRSVGGSEETLVLDAERLPVERRWVERFEEGELPVSVRYEDWRPTARGMAPHRIVTRSPDLAFALTMRVYRHGRIDDALDFPPPNAARLGAQPAIGLAPVPRRVFAVPDDPAGATWVRYWGVPTPPLESWLVNVVVTEAEGRPVEPRTATLELRSGADLVERTELGPIALEAHRRFPVARFHAPPERFHLRHWFTAPGGSRIDRLDYRLRARVNGEEVERGISIPILRPRPTVRLRFPLAGRFLVLVGHDRSDRSHVYERSQRFALDVIPLDGSDRPLVGGTGLSHPPGLVVRAPAPGRVVHARDDVPDEMPPAGYLSLADPLTAIGGNGVVIDHGTGEFSVLFHLRHGSVAVVAGDRVATGQPLGVVGSSGAPGFPHLHYQLQDGPEFLAADGLPARFDAVTIARGLLDPHRLGFPIPYPMRGLVLESRPGGTS